MGIAYSKCNRQSEAVAKACVAPAPYLLRLIFLLMLMISFSISAQKLSIIGVDVLDKITQRAPALVSVGLYSLPDTTFIGDMGSGHNSAYELRSVDLHPGGKYLIKVDNPDLSDYSGQIRSMLENQPKYDPQWVDVVLPDPLIDYIKLPDILISRPGKKRVIELDEVTVKSSRILFYHKGDTLVFNADAFVLAEGTMLDGLIAQLPGVEIKDDGRIFCNGRFVDNLLLNGKDLFNGDKKLMLENLEAYTVKDIAVYDRMGRDSKLLGANAGDMKHVMDVRLKRQYLNGWVANMEAGRGSSKRYLGRLFGLWYSDNASVSAYANKNNLNDRSQPGREGNVWTPDNVMNQGVEENTNSGIVYTVSGPEKKWELQGSVKYERTNIVKKNEQEQQNFFDSGDTYSYGWSNQRSQNWSISTNHLFEFTIAKKFNLTVSPELSYSVNDETNLGLNASFTHRQNNISELIVGDIYSAEDTIINSLINRSGTESLFSTDKLEAAIYVNGFIPLVKSSIRRQTLRFSGMFDYIHRENNRFNRYYINYRTNPIPGQQSYQYFNGSPDNDKKYHFGLTYSKYFTTSGHFDIEYKASGLYQRRTSLLYLLDKINGFDGLDSPLGILPSMYEYTPYIDANQSYESTLREFQNDITPKLITVLTPSDNSNLTIDVSVPLTVLSRNYHYLLPALDKLYSILPTDFLCGFRSMMSLGYTPKDRWQSRTTFTGYITPHKTDLYNLLEIENTTDPLNIFTGNPNLHNAHEYGVSLLSNFWKQGNPIKYTTQVSYTGYINQFARGVLYNPYNGVRTIKPYNINGNWVLKGKYDIIIPFGKYRKFDISSSSIGTIINSADYIGTGTNDETVKMPPKQIVRTFTVQENIKFNWQTGRHRITFNANNRINRSTGDNSGFTSFTSWIGNYGAYALLNMPKGWSVSSDINIYLRRGFADECLNSTDVIWNARLSKSFFKGKLLCILDGYDMLMQLKNISYSINSQARTEIVSNTIPSYVLFHLQWHFNKQPQKRI